MTRKATVKRKTSEVDASVEIAIDGRGDYDIDTGIPFFNHMLAQFAKHGFFDVKIRAVGDLEVDYHHTVEDVAITLGEALRSALGDKRGIARYGECLLPFDDTLVQAAIDLSGRTFFVYRVDVPKDKVGDFDVELCEEFFKSFCSSLQSNLHIELRYGGNLHHIVEATFKAVARALDMATRIDDRRHEEVPSTKGKL